MAIRRQVSNERICGAEMAEDVMPAGADVEAGAIAAAAAAAAGVVDTARQKHSAAAAPDALTRSRFDAGIMWVLNCIPFGSQPA
jgi:thiamine biosynthesis protein ThiC